MSLSNLSLQFNFTNTNAPQDVVVCISKLQSIGELLESNSNDPRLEDIETFKRVISVLNIIFEKVTAANLELTSLSAFKRISSKLSKLESELSAFIRTNVLEVDNIETAVDSILEELPFVQSSQINNLSIEKVNDSLKKIDADALSIHEKKVTAENELTDIGNYKVQIQTLSQLLAGKVLNDSYELRSKTERKAAFLWTIATWAFAILTIAALVYAFVKQIDEATATEINYSLLSTKVLITATLGFIAKWSSKRANRHLAEESKYHRLSINMATINNFIAPLSDEEKYKVISAVAIKTFTDGTGNEISTEFETTSVVDIVKGLVSKDDK